MVNDEWINRVVIRVFSCSSKERRLADVEGKKAFCSEHIFITSTWRASREGKGEIFTLMCYIYICFDREMLIT